MAKRRKYYKRNNYSNYSNEESLVKGITGMIALTIWFFYILYINYIKPNLEIINFYGKIVLIILLIGAIVGGVFYIRQRKENKKLEKERIEKIPEFLRELGSRIENFTPLRNYGKEEPYQLELAGFLKNHYTNLNIEVSKNYTRPDIVIDDIAIEIKGPTGMNELKTIPDKIIRYLKNWDTLYIVLFNVKIVEDEKKNQELFEEWKNDMYENFESKKERIFIIKI